MKPTHLVAIADDFSGAAEIAGVAHAEGLNVYLTRFPSLEHPENADVLVIDSDTRRKASSESVSIHQEITRKFDPQPANFYKKTDSVLRGHILAELQTLRVGFKKSKVLFCPANPARQRLIIDGRYSIGGIPLHKTEFAKDPNYPASTDDIIDLLTGNGQTKDVSFVDIPDIETKDDLLTEAQKIDSETLPAGASPFFSTYLQTLGLENQSIAPSLPDLKGSLLFVSGSCSQVSQNTASNFKEKGWPVVELHPNSTNGLQNLNNDKIGLLKITEQPLPNSSELTYLLANGLNSIELPGHLFIEGGDTAAAILEKFQWQSFTIVHQWEPGITTLQPNVPNSPLLTVKPGSYPWPRKLIKLLEL